MNPRDVLFFLCLAVLFVMIAGVLFHEDFGRWDSRSVANYYLERGAEETGSSNIVSSIVWDFRGFDTLGEETVLFTAAVGVFTVIIFGFRRRKR